MPGTGTAGCRSSATEGAAPFPPRTDRIDGVPTHVHPGANTYAGLCVLARGALSISPAQAAQAQAAQAEIA